VILGLALVTAGAAILGNSRAVARIGGAWRRRVSRFVGGA
jgi:hypothetical protein